MGNKGTILWKTFDWKRLILNDPTLTAHEKIVAIVLNAHINIYDLTCNPSLARIQDQSSLGKTSVVKSLKALEMKGYIQRSTRFIGNTKNRTSNSYKLLYPQPSSPHELPPSSRPELPSSQNKQNLVRETNTNSYLNKKRKSSCPQGDALPIKSALNNLVKEVIDRQRELEQNPVRMF